jgi:hypothetical protein
MSTLSVRIAACLSLALLGAACSDDPSPAPVSSGGSNAGGGGAGNSVAGNSSSGGAAGSQAGSAGSSAAGTSTAGDSGSPSDQCALQGAFSASAEMTLQGENKCNTLGSFKTTYDVTIVGKDITIEQFVEKVPMKGAIDASCKASITVLAPAYREFALTLTASTNTASGVYTEATGSDCRTKYAASLKLSAK